MEHRGWEEAIPLRAAHAVPGCCGDRVGGTVGERGEGREGEEEFNAIATLTY